MLKFLMSLAVYAAVITVIVVAVGPSSFVDSLQSLGCFLNGKCSE